MIMIVLFNSNTMDMLLMLVLRIYIMEMYIIHIIHLKTYLLCLLQKTDEWYTPLDFYQELDNEFHFNLDPCSTDENHKCEKYYTIADNGLNHSWAGYRVFCNPPYSEIDKWVEKAFYETKNPGTLVVLLIPSRTDTRYFHNYIMNRVEIRFVRGRLKFGGSKNSAPFPSMLVIFRGPNV